MKKSDARKKKRKKTRKKHVFFPKKTRNEKTVFFTTLGVYVCDVCIYVCCVSVCLRLEFLEMFGFVSNKNSCYLSYC